LVKNRVAIVVVLLVLLSLAQPVGAAESGGKKVQLSAVSSEINEYRKDFGVSATRAEEALQTQAHAANIDLHTRVEDSLGDAYAGIWFDNRSSEYVVPLLPGTTAGSLVSALTATGLQGDEFRIVRAQSSWAALEVAQIWINGRLLAMINAGLVQTSLDPRRNAVVVTYSESVDAIGRIKIEGVADRARVDVELEELPGERFEGSLEACDQAYCGLPLRGGVRIHDNDPSKEWDKCTAGFKAIGNSDGKRYFLTAGHCVEIPGTYATLHWGTRDDALTPRYVGETKQYTYPGQDWAKIDVGGSWWDVPSWPGEVVYWGSPILGAYEEIIGKTPPVSTDYRINGATSNVTGNYACHSGIVSGTTCGEIGNLNATWTQGGLTVYGLVELMNICSQSGDSGGPVFWKNRALGMWHSSRTDAKCNDTGLYTDINQATQALGVRIPTPETGSRSWHYDNTPGGTLTSKPAIASSESDLLDLFARGTNNALWYRHWNGGGWDPWQDLGGQMSSGPSSVSWGPGRLDVVFLAANGSVEHWYWSNKQWKTDNLGGEFAFDPAVTSWAPGRLDVFARGKTSRKLWHKWWTTTHGWSAWEEMGGDLASGPAAVSWGTNRIDVAAVKTSDSSLQHWYWDGSGWKTDNLGGSFASEPALAAWGPNRLDVFARGKESNKLWHKWWANPNGYSAWEDMGGALTSGLSAVSWDENRIDVVGRGTDNASAHWWWGS